MGQTRVYIYIYFLIFQISNYFYYLSVSQVLENPKLHCTRIITFFFFTDYCLADHIKNERKGSYYFKKTDVYDDVIHNCQYGASKRDWKVKRECLWDDNLKQGYWEKVDLTYCLTPTKAKGIIDEIENVSLSQIFFPTTRTYKIKIPFMISLICLRV